jgi:hydroxymethylbilane synthase
MPKYTIGSRESLLALAQTKQVADYINIKTDSHASILTMKTTGDKILDRTLDKVGGKGLFVKELDLALLEGRTNLSVHSLKDIPQQTDERLPVLGYLPQEDPQDVLVLPKGRTNEHEALRMLPADAPFSEVIKYLDRSKPIGTSSSRRSAQLLRLAGNMEILPVRGNVQTRLKKLDDGQFGALILAAAGLKRLGLSERISYTFSPKQIVPAAGQGIIAVQGRAGEDYRPLEGIFCEKTSLRAQIEQAFVREIGGSCFAPVGVYAEFTKEDGILLYGYYRNEENGKDAYACVPLSKAEEDGIEGLCEQARELAILLKEQTQ